MQHFGSTSKIVDKAEVPPFMSLTSKVVRMEQLVVISFETLPEGQVFEKQLSISCLRRLEHPDWNICTDAFPNHWPLLKLLWSWPLCICLGYVYGPIADTEFCPQFQWNCSFPWHPSFSCIQGSELLSNCLSPPKGYSVTIHCFYNRKHCLTF